MGKLALCLVIGLLLFAASAAGSWYVQQTISPGQNASRIAGPPPLDDTPLNDAVAVPELTGDGELPVAVRPRAVSPEELVRYGASIRMREEALKQREEALQRERNQLKLVMEDVRVEQRELESLQAKVQGKLSQAERLLAEITSQRQQFEQDKRDAETRLEEIRQAETKYESMESDNLRRMSQIFQSMDPERAAEYLTELANDGHLSMAVQLLGNFEEREAARILAAMDDKSLVVQLTDKFRSLKRPERPQRRR